ncbi:MAG: methyltransferase, TIGR04325 family [Chitinophagia bacterium]|nr:methyltransferase, TIGR04325 family [Chitinophagia bacterium]
MPFSGKTKKARDFAVREILKKLLRCKPMGHSPVQFSGPYHSLEKAAAASTGYDASEIAEGVISAMEQVRRGEAAMERDGFALSRPQYPYQLLAVLLLLAAEKGNAKLSVVDFGGSLGSSYFACKPWLRHIRNLRWTVIEQSHFVSIGNSRFADGSLEFAASIETLAFRPDLVLASGVLMYLSDPYETLNRLLNMGAEMCVIDRTATVQNADDIFSVEHVQSSNYTASYPCRFLSHSKLTTACLANYNCVEEFSALDKFSVPFAELAFIGLILRLKNHAKKT